MLTLSLTFLAIKVAFWFMKHYHADMSKTQNLVLFWDLFWKALSRKADVDQKDQLSATMEKTSVSMNNVPDAAVITSSDSKNDTLPSATQTPTPTHQEPTPTQQAPLNNPTSPPPPSKPASSHETPASLARPAAQPSPATEQTPPLDGAAEDSAQEQESSATNNTALEVLTQAGRRLSRNKDKVQGSEV
jgi:hypothetical protein